MARKERKRAAAAAAAMPESEDPALAEVRLRKAGLFQALANPTRIHILECLSRGAGGRGEVAVSDLLAEIGVERANLSQHLGVLRGKGLVASRKEGNQVWCSLRDRRVANVLKLMRDICESDLRQSLALLEGTQASG